MENAFLRKRTIIELDSTTSTNSVALQMARQGAAGGTVVVARTQTRGRGRMQRTWLSPPGTGLYFSMIFRPRLAAADLPGITLAAGVALCRAIEFRCQLAPRLKWPNDLLLSNRKAGGILCESEPDAADSSRASYVVVLGVGLNINTPADAFPADLRARVTSLFIESGRIFANPDMLTESVRQVDGVMEQMEAGGSKVVFAEWQARDAIKGQTLTWVTVGREKVSGTALGLNSDGSYSIRAADGTVHQVLSGDIELAGQ